MKSHAIIEIEEGALTFTVGERGRGTSLQINTCRRFPLPEATTDAVTAALAGIGGELFENVTGVHVIVGNRRAHHFVAEVPMMRGDDVVRFATRESLRVSGGSSVSELLVTPRLVPGRSKGKLRVATAALPVSVWRAIETAIVARGITVLGVHTMESCLAMAAAGRQDAAVLECSAGRARFVLCSDGAPVQVRRFILGGGDVGGEAVVAQLAMELPRTFDWLRESGLPSPDSLVLGNRLELDEEGTAMLQGDLERIDRPDVECSFEDGDDRPGLAATMLLQRVCRGEAVPSLLAEPSIRVPWSRTRIAVLAAVALAGAALTWAGVENLRELDGLQAEAAELRAATVQAEMEITALEATAAPIVESAAEASQLRAALGMRRPVSRLVAEVSNCATDSIHIESLQFASLENVIVGGVVEGSNRKAALAALTGFVDRLRTLPYLASDGRDEVSEVRGSVNRLRFRLVMSWRKP